MRTYIFLICITAFGITPNAILSQKTKITIDKDKVVTIDAVFDILREQTNYTFIYQEDLFKKTPLVVLKKGTIRANKLLEACLAGKNITFNLKGNKIVALAATPPSANQQTATVTGVVTDEDGLPLPGASVVVKGTEVGTVADFDGNFSIDADTNGVLIISYIGYKTQEVSINNKTTINVVLSEDAATLEEVVVVGYGTQKKGTLTGSVSTASGAQLEKSSSPNLASALSGKIAGVFVDTGSNQPGSDNSAIRIRGTNTFRNSSALVVVDGVPGRAGGINRINPADIESISVLKDASAAIYGARAANGVILITTKRGKKGTPKVKLTTNYGFQTFTKLPEMLKGAEYMDLINELNVYKLPTSEWAAAHAGRGAPYTRADNGEVVNPTFSNDRIQKTAAGDDPWLYPDTNWFDEVSSKSAPIARQNIQISGGTDDINYLASLGHLTQAINFKGAPKGFEQYDLRLNLDAQINKHLKMDVGLYGRQEDNRTATRQNVIGDLVRQYPWFPAFWPTGELGPDIENGNNPAVRVTEGPGYDDNSRTYTQSNIGLTLKVPGVEGLQLRGNVSYDRFVHKRSLWNRPWTLYTWDGENRNSSGLTAAQRGPGDPSLTEDHRDRTDFTATFNATYEKSFGDHYFKLLGGITKEQNEESFTRAFKRFFLSSDLAQLDFGGTEGQFSQGNAFERARLNYYGRLNYAYKSKYLLELLFRYDGSDLFPTDNRFGFFPGASAGWVVSEENFFKNSVPWLDFLKLRGSWGQMGNDRVDAYQFNSSYELSFTSLESIVTTANENKVANPDITWETATSTNVGIDLKTLNNKLSIGFDYFVNTREDILTTPNLTLPQTSGITPPNVNIGEFENKGYEFSIGYANSTESGLNYSVTVNFSDSNNKLLFFDEPTLADRPWQRQTGGEIGRPLLYDFDGVFRSQAEIDAETLDYTEVAPVLKPGDARVVDFNGDGKITDADKRRTGGSAFADTQFGINTALNYKNFDFNMYWAGGAGGYINYEWSFMSGTLANVQRTVRDRAWSLDNTNAPLPRLADRGDQWYSGQTDGYLLTRDYIRLKSLEIGYSLDTKLAEKIGAKNIRFSASGTNLITFTDFPFDPETLDISNGTLGNNGTTQGGSQIGVSGGRQTDGSAYPSLRTLNIGLQITF